MKFYLGTHIVSWLESLEIPLFISEKRLEKRKILPASIGTWALDSGGFSQLSLYGEWPKDSSKIYVRHIERYRNEIGNMEWCAPQDWMCEPFIIQKTGLSVHIHQIKTVTNYLALKMLDDSLPFIPVLQGYTLDDYLRCIDMYIRHGIIFRGKVGIGSICRRQGTQEAYKIISTISKQLPYVKLHVFGAKISGLSLFSNLIGSSDSMAWSFDARRSPPISGHTHLNCANCAEYAQNWYSRVLENVNNQLVVGGVNRAVYRPCKTPTTK